MAVSAEIIRIVPGPLDGCKVLIAWGDYFAVQHGSIMWVGTEDKYERATVKSVVGDMGTKTVQ